MGLVKLVKASITRLKISTSPAFKTTCQGDRTKGIFAPCKEQREFEKQKQHKIEFPTFKLTYIMFDDFGIRLLGYRIEFSCLYIPQGHYFMSTFWL